MAEGMSRRSFVKTLAMSSVAGATAAQGFETGRVATSGVPTEWAYVSGRQYSDPFNQMEVDAHVTTPAGVQERVPAFWGGVA